jgi:hypothetical protein
MRFITSLKVIGLVLLLAFSISVAVDVPVFAQKQDVCEGVQLTGGGCNGGDAEIGGLVRTVINIISLLGGIAAVIVIIISGFRLIVSGGDKDGFATARNGILYAIIGLVVIAFAQVIVRFVLGRLG